MKKRFTEEQIIGFLRQAGWMVNLKRVRRLYRQENLMVQKRKRKKVAFGD